MWRVAQECDGENACQAVGRGWGGGGGGGGGADRRGRGTREGKGKEMTQYLRAEL